MASQQAHRNLFEGREDEFEWVSAEEAKRRYVSPQERGRQAREVLELDTLVRCGEISPAVAPDLMARITSKTAPMSLAAALLLTMASPQTVTAPMDKTPSAQSVKQ